MGEMYEVPRRNKSKYSGWRVERPFPVDHSNRGISRWNRGDINVGLVETGTGMCVTI